MKLTWPRSISDLENVPVRAVVWSGKRKVTPPPLIWPKWSASPIWQSKERDQPCMTSALELSVA